MPKSKYAVGSTLPYRLIFDNIIGPLIRNIMAVNENLDADVSINMVFNTDSRKVQSFRSKVAFPIPGKSWLNLSTPNKLITNTSKREVKAGSELIVRLDNKAVERYCEIEYNKTVFVLNRDQWSVVKPKLTLVG